jgi:hypothetical protein
MLRTTITNTKGSRRDMGMPAMHTSGATTHVTRRSRSRMWIWNVSSSYLYNEASITILFFMYLNPPALKNLNNKQ